jgi:suppressor for copper-sensitivity B
MVTTAVVLATMGSLSPLGAAESAASAWVRNDHGDVRLVAATTAVGDAAQVQLGLQFQLKHGWKIYWRSPGDAGFPPAIDWKGSDNLAEAVMSWPAPRRFSVSGLETMGYKDEVVLPVVARLSDPGRGLILRATVDYLACDIICVPGHASLSLDIPAGAAEASPEAHLISRYMARVPGDGGRQGLALAEVRANEDGVLKVVVTADPPLVRPDLFIERADHMQFGKPRVFLGRRGKRAEFDVTPVPNTGDGDLFAKPLTLTVVDGDRGMEAVSNVTPAQPGSGFAKVVAMVGVALLGGAILNLMPCVLPVLSLKVLDLVRHVGQERRAVRRGFLASAAGIVTCFLALASVLAVVRAAGRAVGWGIQFQQPLFLVAMVAILTLFAANLFGLFDIPHLPWVGRAMPVAGRQSGLAGHFAAGAFATLLATPCSAPFVGTAVGFALARGVPEIMVIFAALGIGMALPYVGMAAWPGLAQRLPRPGRWMLTLRWTLGLLLMATCGWLLRVLWSEAGHDAAALVGGLMVILLLLLAAGRRLAAGVRLAAVVLLIGGAAMITAPLPQRPAKAVQSGLTGLWRPFDKQAVADWVADGKVVFVDVTADWCITCQVNMAAVIYRGKVAELLSSPGIIAMQADWTKPDDAIAAYLASFGRYGVPFNAVYGPGAPDGIVLPELLSEDAVLDALAKAGKPSS